MQTLTETHAVGSRAAAVGRPSVYNAGPKREFQHADQIICDRYEGALLECDCVLLGRTP